MSKKKTNPRNIPVSQADMKKAEARWQAELEEMHEQASRRVAIWYQAITYLALIRIYGFDADNLLAMQQEMNNIAARIAAQEGEDADYSIEDVREELAKYDVEFDPEEVKEMEM